MADVERAEQRELFLAYLKATFGEECLQFIDEPEAVQIGERVLYRLTGGKTASRHEPTEQDTERLRTLTMRVAADTGASAVTFEPPHTSGLPYPRLLDLPGSTIIWDTELKKYLESDELLPAHDFPLEWAIGLLRTSENLLMYLDFTHPKVKAVFRVAYEPGSLPAEDRARIREGFKQFREKERDLKRVAEADSRIVWAKLVQVDIKPAAIRIKRVE